MTALREQVIGMVKQMPEEQMAYVVRMLQSIAFGSRRSAVKGVRKGSAVDAISGVLAGKVSGDVDKRGIRAERLEKYALNDLCEG